MQFINRVPFYGLAVLCIDSVAVRALLPRVRKRFVTYGLASDADLQAVHTRVDADGTRFDVLERGRWIGEVRLRMLGRHNAQNALAVIAVGVASSASPSRRRRRRWRRSRASTAASR